MTKDHKDVSDHTDAFDGIGPAYGRPFLERLLLSLIDAHPRKQVQNLPEHILHDRKARLALAMKTLFNEEPSQKLPDDAALFWMANEYARDRAVRFSVEWKAKEIRIAEPPRSVLPALRSERQLAQEASEKFYPKMSDKSERLRRKWQRQRQRWLDLVRFHDDLPELFETQSLAGIWLALAKTKVPVVPNWPAGNPMSEEQMLRTGLPTFEELVELLRSRINRNAEV